MARIESITGREFTGVEDQVDLAPDLALIGLDFQVIVGRVPLWP